MQISRADRSLQFRQYILRTADAVPSTPPMPSTPPIELPPRPPPIADLISPRSPRSPSILAIVFESLIYPTMVSANLFSITFIRDVSLIIMSLRRGKSGPGPLCAC